MKAITVQQPWAWAIISGGKNVENRTRLGTWQKAIGTRVAIHAGQRVSMRGQESPLVKKAWREWTAAHGRPDPYWPLGAVIGTVYVDGAHLEQGGCCAPWGEQSYVDNIERVRYDIVHLVLRDPRPVVPIECRGALGLWTLPDHIAAELGVS